MDLDAVVPDPFELTAAVSGLAVLDFLNAQVQAAPPAVPEWEERGLFKTEVDFLREALHEAFAEPGALPDRGGVGWREHPAEGVVELVPPADLMTRLSMLPQSYIAERQVRERLLLATTAPRRTSPFDWHEPAKTRSGPPRTTCPRCTPYWTGPWTALWLNSDAITYRSLWQTLMSPPQLPSAH